MQIAYLAQGRLYLKQGDAPPKEVESRFALTLIDRAAKSQQRHGWRSQGTIRGMQQGSLWSFSGIRPEDPNARRTQIVSIASSGADELLYVLDTDKTSGLFLYETRSGEERRLVHRKEFRPRALQRNPINGQLVCSVKIDDGTARLAVMEADGGRLRELTEGDAVDESPSWVHGEAEQIVYQSAGIARDQRGFAVALGPYAAMKLDLGRGDLTTILEDPAADFLLPRVGPDGSLFFIRRPYQPHKTATPLTMLLDVLLFPFRLLRAIFHFLNFFSMMFSQKPLTTAGGPKVEGPDQQFLMLYGRVVDAKKAMQTAKGNTPGSLVPANWELVRQRPDGTQTVLAKNVLCYDLCPDGSTVHTDGGTIFHLSPTGESKTLCSGKLIESVVVTG